MAALQLKRSYFAIDNPLDWLERWRHQHRYGCRVAYRGKPVELRWTRRAENALLRQDEPLVIEMQLYFSCVVKKRLIFHRQSAYAAAANGVAPVEVDSRLRLVFRPIAAAACDPLEFVATYPAGRDLAEGPAARMLPKFVEFDYRQGEWTGEFGYHNIRID